MELKLVLVVAVVLGVVFLIVLRALGGTETQELGAPLPLPPYKGPVYVMDSMYDKRVDAQGLVCSGQCEEPHCVSCLCPDECTRLGKPYMGLSGCVGDRMTCYCADSLEELVAGGPRESNRCFDDNGQCRESVMDQMDRWLGRLLPPDEAQDYLLYNCGCEGVFEPGAPDYVSDPLNKLFCPYSSDKIAIYKRKT